MAPCFVFRPDILMRAFWRKAKYRPQLCVIRTAWGDLLEVEPRKFIGAHIYMRGVHELPVCEALWRLAQAGETAVDVGANIGVMTSLLSKKVGQSGRVIGFEPHPDMFRQLQRNVRRWQPRRIDIFDRAVSVRQGTLRLTERDCFSLNEGTATVTRPGGGRSFEVWSLRLDEALGQTGCGVLKIDVEGHEFEVLSGAVTLLKAHVVRDIVFESGWDYPGQTHALLGACGYQVFDLDASFTRPILTVPKRRAGTPARSCDYIATINPQRAQELMGPWGWQVLQAGCI